MVANALFSPVTASAALAAANANCSLSTSRANTLTAHVTGTFTGTLSLQGSLDGVNWVTINAATTWIRQDNGTYVGTIVGAGAVNLLYQTTITGIPYVRVAMTSYTSGTANVTLVASDGLAAVAIDTPLPNGTNKIGFQSAGSSYNLTTAATTNAALVKNAGAQLFELAISNVTASPIYVKLYNKASAPTVGTDVPVLTIPVAAGAYYGQSFSSVGKNFGTGLAIAVTGAAADSDTTAVAAGAHIGATYL